MRIKTSTSLICVVLRVGNQNCKCLVSAEGISEMVSHPQGNLSNVARFRYFTSQVPRLTRNNYRKAKRDMRHDVMIATEVEYRARGYGTWCENAEGVFLLPKTAN